MGSIVHLIQVLVAACIAYVGILILGAVVGVVLILWAIHKLTAYAVSKALWVFLLAALLIPACQRTVYASNRITDKQFAKEVEGIVREDRLDIGEYQYRVHPNVTTEEETLYVTLIEADLTLVSTKLHLFKKHKATRADVDRVLGQLLRDLENAPGTEDLKL